MKTPIRAKCLFCNEVVEEFSNEDYGPLSRKKIYHVAGDSGCVSNPITGKQGTGPHFALTRENIEWIALVQSPGCTINKKKRK